MNINERISKFVSEHTQEAIDLLEELGKIPAPSHKEDLRAEFCSRWFHNQGVKEVWIDEAKNVICKLNCDIYHDIVVLMAHMDVVFDDTTPLPMSRDGNILRAPGIGDDTSNLVNLMMGTKYLLEHKDELETGIMIVANSCEEGLGNLKGCREIFSNYGSRIKEFYSFDGYMPQCTSIPVGSYRYRIEVQAEGGHSYLDFGKDNAIQIAAELINALYGIETPTAEKTTYNVGNIEGGSTVNSIAQEAVMLYEYRSSSQKCLEEMEQKFTDVIERFRRNGKSINVEVLGIRPGMGAINTDELNRFTRNNMDIIRKYFPGDPDIRPFSTDANIPLSLGVIANTIGTISGDKAHTREEWVDLNSLSAGMSIVIEIIQKYLH